MSMERLTKRTPVEFGYAEYMWNGDVDEEDAINRLAAYEDAEEQGRLVVLPCKVGDTVYLVLPKCRASRIPLAECNFFECDDCPRNKREIFEQKATTEMLSMMLFEKYNTLYVFGKTVFLTRAEAEAALKERNT